MSTETAEAPAGMTPFAAAFEAATKEAPEIPAEQAPQPEPKVQAPKETAPPKEKAEPRRMPDSLIKKQEPSPAKVEEPKAPESEIDKIPDPAFKNEGEKNNVANLRKKAKEFEEKARDYEKRTADLEAQIKERDAKGKDTEALQAKLADLEKQNAEYSALVRKVNIELDPEFRRVHIEGRAKLIKNAQAIIEESGGEVGAVETALNLKGKARVEALRAVASDLDQFQAGRLGRVIDALTELDDAAESKRTNPDQYLAERQREEEQRQAKEAEEFTRAAHVAYDSAERKLASELEVLKPVDGLDWWNAQAKEIREKARAKYETNTDPAVAAETCIRAEAMSVYRDYYIQEREQVKELETKLAERDAELQKLYGKSPSLTGNRQGASGKKGGFYGALEEAAGA